MCLTTDLNVDHKYQTIGIPLWFCFSSLFLNFIWIAKTKILEIVISAHKNKVKLLIQLSGTSWCNSPLKAWNVGMLRLSCFDVLDKDQPRCRVKVWPEICWSWRESRQKWSAVFTLYFHDYFYDTSCTRSLKTHNINYRFVCTQQKLWKNMKHWPL